MEKTLTIGLILKPQGILGELKVKPMTDDVNRFKTLKTVVIDGEEYKVMRSRIATDAVYISLNGVADRNQAEAFRNKEVKVLREDAVKLEEGRYFIVDVIGSILKTDAGKVIGKITDITSSNVDIYTVLAGDKKEIRFPFLKDLVLSVDIESKVVLVNDKRFFEVAVYED